MKTPLTPGQIITALESHSVAWRLSADDTVLAREDYTIDGVAGTQWVTAPVTVRTMLDWLGY